MGNTDGYLPARHLIPHRKIRLSINSRRGRIGPTLNEERNVDPPYASRDSYNNPLPLPNGDAAMSACISFGASQSLPQKKTHMRSTINSEEAARAT